MDRITAFFLVITSLIPFIFALKFSSLYYQKNRDFYLSWAFGFFFYGVINVIDSMIDIFSPTNPIYNTLSTVVSFFAFSFIVTGIGQLVRRKRMLFLLSLTVPILSLILTMLGYPSSTVEVFTSVFYLGFTLVLYYLRLKYKLDLEIVDLGWLIILLANLGYAFNQISLLLTVIFSLLGKTIAFLWMAQPRFVAFTDRIEFFVGSGAPRTEKDLGSITVLESSSNKKTDLNWIVKSLSDEILSESRKILVVTSNLFTEIELLDSGVLAIPNIHVVRMDSSISRTHEDFSSIVLDIPNNLDSLKVSMIETINSIIENDVKACFVLYNISTLIHAFGWRQIYSLMISTMPKLKQGMIYTQVFISPGSHENMHEVKKILLLANRVMKISPE